MITKPTLAERDLRYSRIREAMKKQGFDALLIAAKGHGWTGRGYLRYLTDFHIWGHDGIILFPLDDEPLLCMSSGPVAGMVARRGWINEHRGDWHVTPTIVEEVKRRGLDKGKLGVVGHTWILGAGLFDILKDGLADAELVNADLLLNKVRAIKSPFEIQQYRELWTVSKGALERFVTHLEPGMTERQASAEPYRYLHEHGARGDLIFINSNPPGDRILEMEGILAFHMEICHASGHYNESTVTLAFRDPTELELRLAECEINAYDKVMEASVPGVTLEDLFHVFQASMRDQGWVFTEPRGVRFEFHAQGMDWMEWPTYSWNDPNAHALAGNFEATEPPKIEAGMVFNYHPTPLPGHFEGHENVKIAKSACHVTDHLLITKDGGVRLSGDDWDFRWRLA
ncbi:MAG: M24 family metallopeptidase [Thermaerobacterales bacterium]